MANVTITTCTVAVKKVPTIDKHLAEWSIKARDCVSICSAIIPTNQLISILTLIKNTPTKQKNAHSKRAMEETSPNKK